MIKNVGIIGAGAIGCSFGSTLFSRYRDNFYFIAKGKRAARLRNDGIKVNNQILHPLICSSKEDVELDLILMCVKNYDLEQTLEDMKDIVTKKTIIIPLLNGVTAVSKVKEAFPSNSVPYGIVMRTDAERIGEIVTVSTKGEIQIGFGKDEKPSCDIFEVKKFLEAAGIRANVYEDMRYMLWRKWMINIGSNQVSVLTGAQFKYFGQFEEIIILVSKAIQEIVDISKRLNIGLTEKDRDDIVEILINYPPEKKTSMLQDIEAKRRTEIDYFAGTVIKFGKELGIATPVNQILYYAIKAKEKVGLAEKSLWDGSRC